MKYLLSVLFIVFYTFSNAQVNTFPWTDDFESFANCGFACAGPCGLSGGWTNATGDGAEWIVDQGGTSSLNTGPSVDHKPGTAAGTYLYTETSGCNQQTANLISPTFDFSILSNPTVNFWWHMFGAAMGTMHFDLDTGNGTWITDVIPSWTANTNAWSNREVNLTNLAGSKSNVRFRIRGQTGTSFTSDMAIDDFRVFNDIPDDLALSDIISPVQDCGVTGVIPIEVEISNVGASDQSNFSVAYQINNLNPVVEAFSGILPSDQKTNFTFSSSFNFSPNEDFVFKTWVVFPQDLNNLNDTLSEGVKEAFPLELINFSGFNGNNIVNALPGWSEGKGNSLPSGAVSNWVSSDSAQEAFLGSPTAKINLSGNTNNEWIISPPILISNSSRLFFSVAATGKNGIGASALGSDDKLQVYVSTNCGVSFTSVLTIDQSSNLTNALRQFALNLIPYVGQEIVIGFKAQDGPTNNLEDYDLHLTLIEARRVFPNDVGIIDFRTQDGDKIIQANTGEEVFVRLKNFGSTTVSNIPIVSKIGTVNFQNVFTGNLSSNAEVEIKLGAYYGSINGSPNINLKSFTLYNGDTINSNDTLNTVLLINGATSIEEKNLLADITISPNPFKEVLRIETGSFNSGRVEIRNINGGLVYSEEIQTNRESLEIKTSNFPKGLYLVQIQTDQSKRNFKCIKD